MAYFMFRNSQSVREAYFIPKKLNNKHSSQLWLNASLRYNSAWYKGIIYDYSVSYDSEIQPLRYN